MSAPGSLIGSTYRRGRVEASYASKLRPTDSLGHIELVTLRTPITSLESVPDRIAS
jgi:hypothetical protein